MGALFVSMPHCTNCGSEVEKTHRYCGQCGDPLTAVNDGDGMPPSAYPRFRDGFLSQRSIQYISDILNEEVEFDYESVEFSQLARDVAAGLGDFALIEQIDEFLFWMVIYDQVTDAEVLQANFEDLTPSEQREAMMWHGLFDLLKIYDRSFETEFDEILKTRMHEMIKETKEEIEG